MRQPTLSPAVPPSSVGCQCPRPLHVQCPSLAGGSLASQLVVDNSSTTRLSAATPISAHHAALREEIDGVRQNSHNVDGFIVVYAKSTVMLNATQMLPSDAASWFPHDAPASTPPTHPHSHLWCHCCPCLLKSHLQQAWTLPCNSPTMLASMCVDGGSGMPERWWRVHSMAS